MDIKQIDLIRSLLQLTRTNGSPQQSLHPFASTLSLDDQRLFVNVTALLLTGISASHQRNTEQTATLIEYWLEHVLIFFYAVLFLAGLVSNTLVIYFVLAYKSMRSMTNKYITNLAIADLFVTFICIPVALTRLIYKQWIFGQFMCVLTGFVQGVALSISVMTFTAISIDRFYMICKPIRARSICTQRRLNVTMLIIWVFSLTIMSPLLFVFKYEENRIAIAQFDYSHSMRSCIEKWPMFELKIVYDSSLILFLFVLPTLFMSYAYFTISKVLWFGELNVACNGGGHQTDATSSMAAHHSNHHHHHQLELTRTNSRSTLIRMITWRRRPQPNKKSVNNSNEERANDDKNVSLSLLPSSGVLSSSHSTTEHEAVMSFREHKSKHSHVSQLHEPRTMKKRTRANQKEDSSIDQISNYQTVKSESAPTMLHRQQSFHDAKLFNMSANYRLFKLNGQNAAIYKLLKNRRRVVKLMITLVFLFLVSWFPYHLVAFITEIVLFWQEKSKSRVSEGVFDVSVHSFAASMATTTTTPATTATTATAATAATTTTTTTVASLLTTVPFLGTIATGFESRLSVESDEHSQIVLVLIKIVYPIVLALALGHSASNAVVYIAMNHGFQKKIKASFKSFFDKRKVKNNNNNNNIVNYNNSNNNNKNTNNNNK